MACTIIHEELGFHRKFTESFDLEDIISANLEVIEHADVDDFQYVIDDLTGIANLETNEYAGADDFQYVIDDLTGITSATLSDDDLPYIVNLNKILSRSAGKLKIAIVIDLDPLQIALAEKFCEQMKGSLFETSVFDTLGEARKWIATPS